MISSSFSSVSTWHFDLIPSRPIMTLSVIYDCMYSFSMWNCNILKFTLERFPCFSYITTVHTVVIHEHSLFQCVTHICRILTQEIMEESEWLPTAQIKENISSYTGLGIRKCGLAYNR
jgi:hypothetical protein